MPAVQPGVGPAATVVALPGATPGPARAIDVTSDGGAPAARGAALSPRRPARPTALLRPRLLPGRAGGRIRARSRTVPRHSRRHADLSGYHNTPGDRPVRDPHSGADPGDLPRVEDAARPRPAA